MHRRANANEAIFSGQCEPLKSSPDGIELRVFASSDCGAAGFSTGTATFRGGAELPCHLHNCAEAVTVLKGVAVAVVECRAYRLTPLDCLFIPAGYRHSVANGTLDSAMLAHCSFSSAQPTRTFVDAPNLVMEDRGTGQPQPADPEKLSRFSEMPVYELSNGTFFTDLFAKRLGASGICGGYGRFATGASLPCHFHEYDESITILGGEAHCLVQGASFHLNNLDTAFIPTGKPHRFLNQGDTEMAMIWVYAGDEPDRTIVGNDYCSGALCWPSEATVKP